MKYLQKSFSVGVGENEAYRRNWESVFGRPKEVRRRRKARSVSRKKAMRRTQEAAPSDQERAVFQQCSSQAYFSPSAMSALSQQAVPYSAEAWKGSTKQ